MRPGRARVAGDEHRAGEPRQKPDAGPARHLGLGHENTGPQALIAKMSSHETWLATTAPGPRMGRPSTTCAIPRIASTRRLTQTVIGGVQGRARPCRGRSASRSASVASTPAPITSAMRPPRQITRRQCPGARGLTGGGSADRQVTLTGPARACSARAAAR